MTMLQVQVSHAQSSTVDDQIAERYGVAEVDDSVAVALASWYQSPGSVGRILAALASGTVVGFQELMDDIHATRREIDRHNEADAPTMRRQLDMLATWVIDRTQADTQNYVAG